MRDRRLLVLAILSGFSVLGHATLFGGGGGCCCECGTPIPSACACPPPPPPLVSYHFIVFEIVNQYEFKKVKSILANNSTSRHNSMN